MRKNTLTLLVLTLTMCFTAFGQLDVEEQIRYIRKEFGRINQQCEQITPAVLKLNDDTPMEIKQWSAGEAVIKIRLTKFKQAGEVVSDYYFGNQGFIFAFTQAFFKDEFSNPYIRENRYYFKDEDTMIRWLDHEKKPVDPASEQFIERGNQIWADMHWAGEVMWMHTSSKMTTEANGNEHFMGPNHFDGIIVGTAINQYANRLTKGLHETGEGSFDVFYIMDKQKRLGYLYPDRKNEEMIGAIIITTTQVATSHGIRVGSTYEQLKKAIPDLVVHGSELEGRTTVMVGNLQYLLDINLYDYEVEENTIDPNVKVKEIMLVSN